MTFKECVVSFDMDRVFCLESCEPSVRPKGHKKKVTLEDPSKFPELAELIQGLGCPDTAQDSIKRLAKFVDSDSVPDPTELLKASDLFVLVVQIMEARDEETLSECLDILVLFTHADFHWGCPFLEGELLWWIIQCLGHPKKLNRQYACRILCNLFIDGVVGVEVMKRCYGMGIIGVLYEMCRSGADKDVGMTLCNYFIDHTLSVFPDELRVFVPFIPLMIDEIRDATKLSETAISCLASLCFNDECLEHMLSRPDVTFTDVIRRAVFDSRVACVADLFNIVNRIIEHDSECSAFYDEQFVRHTGVVLKMVDPDDARPLLAFLDSMVEDHWDVLMVSGIIDTVLEVAKTGKYKLRKCVGFLLVHMIDQCLDMARYPEWLNVAVLMTLDLLEGLSARKCQVTLDVLLKCVDRNPQRFVPLLSFANAGMFLEGLSLDESTSPEVMETANMLLHALS